MFEGPENFSQLLSMSHWILLEHSAKVRTVLFISQETFLVLVAIGHQQVALSLSVMSVQTAPTVLMEQIIIIFFSRHNSLNNTQ